MLSTRCSSIKYLGYFKSFDILSLLFSHSLLKCIPQNSADSQLKLVQIKFTDSFWVK